MAIKRKSFKDTMAVGLKLQSVLRSHLARQNVWKRGKMETHSFHKPTLSNRLFPAVNGTRWEMCGTRIAKQDDFIAVDNVLRFGKRVAIDWIVRNAEDECLHGTACIGTLLVGHQCRSAFFQDVLAKFGLELNGFVGCDPSHQSVVIVPSGGRNIASSSSMKVRLICRTIPNQSDQSASICSQTELNIMSSV